MDVTICIVNWNAAEYLRACLDSLRYASHPPDAGSRVTWEVIVVDNASSDGSQDMVRHSFSDVRLIANSANVGFAAANNQAFDIARGRYLLLLNNDTRVLPAAIDGLVAFADQHPEAGIVGPRVLNPDGSLQRSCRSFPSLSSLLWRALYLDKLFPHNPYLGAHTLSHWDYASVRRVDAVTGCCMLVRRELLKTVGGLDEGYFMYFEELDWCRRVQQAGWQVLYTPAAEIVHYGGRSAGQQQEPMSRVYVQSLVRYFRRHHGLVAGAVARLLAATETGLRTAYWLARGALQPDLREQASGKLRQYWPAFRWLVWPGLGDHGVAPASATSPTSEPPGRRAPSLSDHPRMGQLRQAGRIILEPLRRVRRALRPYRAIPTDPQQWDAEYASGRWNQLSGLGELAHYSVIAGYCHYLKPKAAILDVGCGDGVLLDRLHPGNVRRYVGVDYSAEAIRRANGREAGLADSMAAPSGEPLGSRARSQRFVVADARAYDPGEYFDVVVFNESLYYFEDPLGVMARYQRWLESDGVFIVSMNQTPDTLKLRRKLGAVYALVDEVQVHHQSWLPWVIGVYR